PRRVLARRAAAEVAPREQDLRARVLRPVQLEVGILHPVEEEELAVAGPLDPLQELLRDDLVGVDVAAVEHGDRGRDATKRLHPTGSSSRSRLAGSVKRPASAVAAATTGETRCVRPPAP